MHWCRFTTHHALKSVWLEPHQHIVKCDIFQASSPLQSWSSRTLSLCWRSHVFQCRATILRRTSGESQRSGFQKRSRMSQLRRNPLMKRLVLSWQSLILAPRLLKALMSRRGPHEYANVGWRAPTASLAVFAAPVADTARFGSVELSDQSWIVLMLSKAVPALWLAGAKFIAICFCGPPTLQLQQDRGHLLSLNEPCLHQLRCWLNSSGRTLPYMYCLQRSCYEVVAFNRTSALWQPKSLCLLGWSSVAIVWDQPQG